MADKKDSMEKLLKLYALATRGVGGERENARRLLNRLLEKTGVTIESVELAAGAGVTSLQSYSFSVRKYFPGFSQVLAQLVYSFGLRDGDSIYVRVFQKERVICYVLELNRAEAALLDVFWKPCYEAFRRSDEKMKIRQAQELSKLKEKQAQELSRLKGIHEKEAAGLALGFIAKNELYSKDVPAEDSECPDLSGMAFVGRDYVGFDHDHEGKLGTCLAQLEDRGAEQ